MFSLKGPAAAPSIGAGSTDLDYYYGSRFFLPFFCEAVVGEKSSRRGAKSRKVSAQPVHRNARNSPGDLGESGLWCGVE